MKIFDEKSRIVVLNNLVLSVLAVFPFTNPLVAIFQAEQFTHILPASSFLLIAAFSLVYKLFVLAPANDY